jgi:hypothetical protein
MPDDDDEIRLTIPPDADLQPVLVAAVAAVVRRSGLGDAEVARSRDQAADAFATAIEQGAGDAVTLTASAGRRTYRFEVRSGTWAEVRHQPTGG